MTPAALRAALGGVSALTIRITEEAWRHYRESIACNPPETYALIAGSLDAPDLITEFHFLPPRQGAGGAFASGPAHVQLDHHGLNYLIDRKFRPNGKYMLGLWHSHPGGYTAPSEPDRLLCAAILRNDDSPGRRWPYFVAPITTFDADGRDRVAAWVMRKGTDTFEPALFAPPVPAAAPPPAPIAPLPLPAVEAGTPAVAADATPIDPMAALAGELAALLARPDGLVGLPRYRAGVHLRAALRSAETDAGTELQP